MRAPREEPTPSRPAPTVQVDIAEALTGRTGQRRAGSDATVKATRRGSASRRGSVTSPGAG